MAPEPSTQSTALERAVLRAEQRTVKRRPWYRHNAVWGIGGIAIGIGLGFVIPRPVNSSRVAAMAPVSKTASGAAQVFAPKKPVPTVVAEKPKPTNMLRDQGPEPTREIIVPADLPVLPNVSGDIGMTPPDIRVEPLRVEVPKVEKAKPKVADSGPSKAVVAVQDRIAELRLQRLELLKSFYEDAIPVRHLDEDIAAAEAELKALAKNK